MQLRCCKQSYLVTPYNQKFLEFQKLTTWSSDGAHIYKLNVCQRLHDRDTPFSMAFQIFYMKFFQIEQKNLFWTCSRFPSITHIHITYSYVYSIRYIFLVTWTCSGEFITILYWIFSFISSLKIVSVFLDRIERIPLDSLAVDTGCASLRYAIHQFMIQQCMIHA